MLPRKSQYNNNSVIFEGNFINDLKSFTKLTIKLKKLKTNK